MPTFRVVDEDGDWYEMEGDPADWLALTRGERDGALAALARSEAKVGQLRARLAELEAHPWIKVVWLATDDEGNFGAWNDPDHARQQLAHDWAAQNPGTYEWVNDTGRTCELLLRDGEPTGLTLRMVLVADADEGA